jgi:signal transduction histidine kinase
VRDAARALAATAAAAVDARVDTLRARLDALAAEADTAGSASEPRLAAALTEEPGFASLHRIGAADAPLAAAPPVAGLAAAGLPLMASMPGGAGALVATLAPEALLAPLVAHLRDAAPGARLPADTRLSLAPRPAGSPPAGTIVAEAPLATSGWRVRVEVPNALGHVRARLAGGLAALLAASAAGVALGAAALRRRSRVESADAPSAGAPPSPSAELAPGPTAMNGDDAMASRSLLHDIATSLTLAGVDARRLADGEAGLLEAGPADLARQLAARIEAVSRLVRSALADSGPGGEADIEPTDRRPLSLLALAEDAVDAVAGTAQARRIDLAVESPSPGDESLVGFWDSDSLGRVIGNLLHNALKYTPPGGAIRVSVRRDGRAALLAVRDTGVGVRADELEAVFEAGRRGSAAARTGAPGLGLGLATCRAIVQAHGGRIWIESGGEGQGSTAAVRLPLDRRRAPRGHGRWPARVDWGGGREVEATVETISRSGAAVRLPVAPPVGALVAVRIAGLPREAGVATDGAPVAPGGDEEVAALGRVVRILEAGHPEGEGRPAGAPDAREPLAAIAFAEVGPGTGARLERAAATAGGRAAASDETGVGR